MITLIEEDIFWVLPDNLMKKYQIVCKTLYLGEPNVKNSSKFKPDHEKIYSIPWSNKKIIILTPLLRDV